MTRGTALGLVAVLIGFGLFAWYVSESAPPRPEATAALGELADPGEVYDPVRAGEPLPRGYSQLLPRDAILPVYEPRFVPAAEAGWPDDTLVIGVADGEEAKAYPVSFLNHREMVIDRLAGSPILVTW